MPHFYEPPTLMCVKAHGNEGKKDFFVLSVFIEPQFLGHLKE